MMHIAKIIGLSILAFCIVLYLLFCWVNLIDNDSNTHEPADNS